MKNYYSNKGFTLIELLIAVAIIGLLATIAIPSYNEYIKTANEKAVATNATTLSGFLENYFYDNETYIVGTYTGTANSFTSALDWIPTDNDKFKYTVTAGTCGDIKKCYTITITSLDDPTITYTLSSP